MNRSEAVAFIKAGIVAGRSFKAIREDLSADFGLNELADLNEAAMLLIRIETTTPEHSQPVLNALTRKVFRIDE